MKVFVFMILSCVLLNTSSALYMTNNDPNINEILGRYSFPKGPIMEQNFEEELDKLRTKIPPKNVQKMKVTDDIMDQLEQRYSISRLFKKK